MSLLRQWLRLPTVRFAVLVALLGLFGLALLVLPRPDLDRLPHLTDGLGPLAPLVPVLVGAVLLVVLVPRTFVTLAWGALFGPLAGGGYALAAALLAAGLGFGIGRLLGRDFVRSRAVAARDGSLPASARANLAQRIRQRLARLDEWLCRTDVLDVVTVRLLPLGGFGLVSYGYGTTGARLVPYLVGSLLASAPSAFGWAAMGAAATSPGNVNWFAVAPAGLGLIVTAVMLRRWWRAERRGQASPTG